MCKGCEAKAIITVEDVLIPTIHCSCTSHDVLHQPLPLQQIRSVQLGAALIARRGQRIPEVKNKLEKLC